MNRKVFLLLSREFWNNTKIVLFIFCTIIELISHYYYLIRDFENGFLCILCCYNDKYKIELTCVCCFEKRFLGWIQWWRTRLLKNTLWVLNLMQNLSRALLLESLSLTFHCEEVNNDVWNIMQLKGCINYFSTAQAEAYIVQ